MLNQSSMKMEFDPSSRKQVDEAKRFYIQAKREGRKITDTEGAPLSRFDAGIGGFVVKATDLTEAQCALHILDETGDRRIIWDSRDPNQTQEAARLYEEYVAKGWKPYAITRTGGRGYRISAFDAGREEIVFDDKTLGEKMKGLLADFGRQGEAVKTVRQKLSSFAEKFTEVKLLPRTYPG